jgi:hypothetical protein
MTVPAACLVLQACACALLAAAPAQTISVFELPIVRAKYVALEQSIQSAFREGRHADAERICREAIQLIPQIPQAYYNLACAQARQAKPVEALASLKRAVEQGFNQAEWLQQDADLESLRQDSQFAELIARARQNTGKPQGLTQEVKPRAVSDGVALVTESNTGWDARTGLFHVFFALPANPVAAEKRADSQADPVVRGQGEIGEQLRRWFTEGTAAGNAGDFYDNHDGDHSNLAVADYPQITPIEYDAPVKKHGYHLGLQCLFLFNQVTLGNSSMANVSGPYWRSMPRIAYADPRRLAILAAQYASNQLYAYPEHRDHDPGHNGPDGYGDVYPTNSPFVIISQGSSGSDQPFLRAIACTLAAFRPEVKKRLTEQRALAPTLQLILRSCLSSAPQAADYLTGKAHPSVFRGEDLDVKKMIHMAHELQVDDLPPQVRLSVREEDESVVGRDYFEIGPRERLFDSPALIARVGCSTKFDRRLVISAEESRDPNGHPLTWHWSVLRGDEQAIRIRPLNEQKSVVELNIPYHERRPVAAGSPLESNRVDIGAFVHNGKYYSAPAFVTVLFLDDEKRTYFPDHRIQSVEYKAAADGGNYADPMIHTVRSWRDEYRYDAQQHLIGWTRQRGNQTEEFTADGALVTARDAAGRPARARSVVYVPIDRQGVPTLEQREGDEILVYEYASPEDRLGRVASREKVPSAAKPEPAVGSR